MRYWVLLRGHNPVALLVVSRFGLYTSGFGAQSEMTR